MSQLGLELDYTDPNTHEAVPWAMPSRAMFDEIKQAPWKVLDIETTGLNPASKELKVSAKDLRRGVNPTLRLRIMSVLYKTDAGIKVVGVDFDQLTEAEKRGMCDAVMTNVVIGHNIGFDAYWTRRFTRTTPALLLDTMLIARVLFPEQPLVMAQMCNDENEDPEFREAAESMFTQSRSGWSLADLALTRLRKKMDKSFQGPKNWAQPFLTQESYDYATGDVRDTYALLLSLFGITEDDDLLGRYFELRANSRALRIIEPQVMDVVAMRENGMPWVQEVANKYVETQWQKVAEYAEKMIAMEPELKQFEIALKDAEKGVTADLKECIGRAFERRGLQLETTSQTGAFKIGEKDLRKVRAQVNTEAAQLFDTWVGLNRAKKAGGMAQEVTGFAVRSGDGRLHPNTGHGPATGRLASSEPNCQQFPRDQGFRNGVTAREGCKIIACDYSALDMRVGAALAIRAQRRIFEAYMGDREVSKDVYTCIARVFEGRVTLEQAQEAEKKAIEGFEAWKNRRETVADTKEARRRYWDEYRKRSRHQLLMGFQRCLKEVRMHADAEGTAEWGSLRDAFSIEGMDIHTWTALGMVGQDPKAMFFNKSPEEVASGLKKCKKELGDKRQTGKVGNLSLLYAMKTLGLLEAAAKNYNIHWTFEEGDNVRMGWLATYVEIDLWHKWTELNPHSSVYVPDPDKGNRYTKKDVYASYTLGDRLIYAMGINAALSYEDQSTGADIMAAVMVHLRENHLPIYKCIVNQVHDELVFEVPDEHVEEYNAIISKTMRDCAEHFLMPFGVKGECSPAIGQVWLKD